MTNSKPEDWQDEASFAELFEANKGPKYDKGEKDFGDPDKSLDKKKKTLYAGKLQDKLDLHGRFVNEIEDEIIQYIKECRQRNLSFVLIVVGQGQHSKDGQSKLRPEAMRILNNLKNNHLVRDFKIAKPCDGGYGALYVYLK